MYKGIGSLLVSLGVDNDAGVAGRHLSVCAHRKPIIPCAFAFVIVQLLWQTRGHDASSSGVLVVITGISFLLMQNVIGNVVEILLWMVTLEMIAGIFLRLVMMLQLMWHTEIARLCCVFVSYVWCSVGYFCNVSTTLFACVLRHVARFLI